MLSLIEQPEDYSQMLKRVFVATLTAGIVSTLILGYFSPPVQSLLFHSSTKLNLGFADLPWLIVVIPLFLAVLSRAVKLHDRISDLLGIRRCFDRRHILMPLARGVDIKLDDHADMILKTNRHALMRKTFYTYAPNARDAAINRQYVAAALDQWGWFWSCLEPSVVFLLASVFAGALVGFPLALAFVILSAILIFAAFGLWFSCVRAGKKQVDDILDDKLRRTSIAGHFNAVLGKRA